MPDAPARLVLALAAAVAVLAAAGPVGATEVPNPGVPVVPCKVAFGVSPETRPRLPGRISGVPASVARRTRFYSDGFVTVLAPKGWACSGLAAADGSQSLSVYPRGQSDPLRGTPKRTATAVTVFLDYTGHGPGAALVCALFPGSRAASLAQSTGSCPSVPAGEVHGRPRPGVVSFVDPPGVAGSGIPSGGAFAASGAVVYPTSASEPSSVAVAKITCTLAPGPAALCDLIVTDFLGRTVKP